MENVAFSSEDVKLGWRYAYGVVTPRVVSYESDLTFLRTVLDVGCRHEFDNLISTGLGFGAIRYSQFCNPHRANVFLNMMVDVSDSCVHSEAERLPCPRGVRAIGVFASKVEKIVQHASGKGQV